MSHKPYFPSFHRKKNQNQEEKPPTTTEKRTKECVQVRLARLVFLVVHVLDVSGLGHVVVLDLLPPDDLVVLLVHGCELCEGLVCVLEGVDPVRELVFAHRHVRVRILEQVQDALFHRQGPQLSCAFNEENLKRERE
jgi:hypothetical protein